MTALPDWDIVDPLHTDAELVGGSVAGDQAAFAQIYDRYADRLHDFCVGMLRDRDAAADCVQDTFCLAASRLPQLREPDKLRPWLYSIARNEALRRLRERRRETPSDELPDIPSEDDSPDTLAARTELADLIAEAAAGLSDRERAVFDLAFRHGLSGPELADALGVNHSNANTMVHRLKGTIERSLGALLVARRAQSRRGDCAELDEMLANWDGHFTVLMRKRISRHIESCPNCDDERRRLVSPTALLGAAPVFIPAPAELREQTLEKIQLTSHGSPMQSQTGSRKWMLPAVSLLAVLSASAALAFILLNKEPVSITPTKISGTAPEATGQTPPPNNPLPPPIAVQPPPQPPTVQSPRSATPQSSPQPEPVVPAEEQAPVSEPTTEAPPPTPAPPPDSAPSLRPPMSFSPTVMAPRPVAPTPGGDGGSAPNPAGGP